MRKLLMLGVFFLGALCLTGCGSKSLTCTYKGESGKQEITFYLDGDDKVTSVTISNTFDSTSDAKDSYDAIKENYKDAKVSRSGKKVTVKNAEDVASYYKNYIGMSKDEVKKDVQDDDVTCK